MRCEDEVDNHSEPVFRLEETKKEILGKYPSIEIKIVALDFATASAADYTRLQAEISKLEIGVLYNNVGVSYDYAEAFQNIPEEKVPETMLHPTQ